MDNLQRCHWCNLKNPLYIAYHDQEWGVPVHDERKLYEMLLLESFQAGLSWECVLNKREAFRETFDGFDYQEIALYDKSKVEELRLNPHIIRNQQKINAAITNAQVFMEIQKEYGSFDTYIWRFTDGETIHENNRTSSPLSDTIASDLHQRGIRFMGTTLVYSYLQAIGIIYAHEKGCWLSIPVIPKCPSSLSAK